MFNKSEPLETYSFEGFRWNCVESIEVKLGVVWNPFQTSLKPVLFCSVDKALDLILADL